MPFFTDAIEHIERIYVGATPGNFPPGFDAAVLTEYYATFPDGDPALMRAIEQVAKVIGQAKAETFRESLRSFRLSVYFLKGRADAYRRGDGDNREMMAELYTYQLAHVQRMAEYVVGKMANLDEFIDGMLVEYSEAKPPTQWAKIFHVSWRTLKRRFDAGEIRAVKVTEKYWRIHRDDVPS